MVTIIALAVLAILFVSNGVYLIIRSTPGGRKRRMDRERTRTERQQLREHEITIRDEIFELVLDLAINDDWKFDKGFWRNSVNDMVLFGTEHTSYAWNLAEAQGVFSISPSVYFTEEQRHTLRDILKPLTPKPSSRQIRKLEEIRDQLQVPNPVVIKNAVKDTSQWLP